MKLTHGAYILARFSTDHQEVDSIEVQVGKCRAWCEAQALPVLDVFADEAVSGMKNTRPEYARMMRQLADGGADTVVIYDQSRMFRKMTAWFAFREEIERLGVRVAAVTQPMVGGDLRDPANFLQEGSQALFNQMWVLQTRQKVVEKMRYMAAQGKHTGGTPPLGYIVVDGKLEVCEDEAETVRGIFRDYAAGRSYREIIQRLNAEGKRTKGGNTFGTNSIHDLLKNEKYIGVLTYGKVEKRPDGSRNTHSTSSTVIRMENMLPAIIDRDTWNEVQAKMEKNKRTGAGRPTSAREYPLKGKVFCRECKSPMHITRSQSDYYYYNCSGRKRKGICDLPTIRADELERIVGEAVSELVGQPENVEGLVSVMHEERAAIQRDAVQQSNVLMARRAEISKQLEAATNAVLAGMVSDTLMRKVHELEAERLQIDRDMQTLRERVGGTELPDERIRELFKLAQNDISSLLSIVVRVEVGRDEIVVWTILDAEASGEFDFTADGVRVDNNSWCRWWDTHNYYQQPQVYVVGGLLKILLPRKEKCQKNS